MAEYYWTKKAELDWRERHPEVKNPKRFKRTAGTIATFSGEPLQTGEIQRTWKQKGWVVDDIKKVYHTTAVQAYFNESKLRAEEKTREQKWMILYDLIMVDNLTVGQAAKRIGSNFNATYSFITEWQERLGSQLGYIKPGQGIVSQQNTKAA